MSEREKLLRRIAMYDFALVEIDLFLDTHPDDVNAIQLAEEYRKKSDELREEYERKYGPIESRSMEKNRWGWISNPWPWNTEEE